MNATTLLRSSIGKKAVMAVTGVILLLYVIGHLLGNLQIFMPPEQINSYAHTLQSLHPAIWSVRIVLLIAVVLHIWMAVSLTLENRDARPVGYEYRANVQATYAARTMRWSGFIVLVFIVFHLAHYTVFVVNPEYAELTAPLPDGQIVPDVHQMLVTGFSNVWVSLFYILSVGLLSMHMRHGISSMFQSVGWRNLSWGARLDKTAVWISVLYFLGNASIPLAVLTGLVR